MNWGVSATRRERKLGQNWAERVMQIVFHIVARPSLRESLRELVIADIRRGEYELEIESEKKVGRRGGWAKIKAPDLPGAINITWFPNSKTLIARAIAKQGNTPSELIAGSSGIFLSAGGAMFVRSRSTRRKRWPRLVRDHRTRP